MGTTIGSIGSVASRLRLAILLGLAAGMLLFTGLPVSAQDKSQAPSNLTASIVGSSVALSWDAPTNDAGSVDGYEILRRQPGVDEVGTFHSLVADTGNTDTSYTDNTTEASNSYTYRVKALRGEEKSVWSNYVRVDMPGPVLTGFTLVDASDQSLLATLGDGDSVELDNPDTGSFGIRVETRAGANVGSVKLELSGQKSHTKTENIAPYSLYGDDGDGLHGEPLPAGSYTLKATAFSQSRLQGNELGTLEVSFTVKKSNSPAAGAPTITGTAQAGQTLTASTSGITDADGLTGVSYTYQWLADDADIEDATGETYDVSDDDVGKTIKVRVSFTDNGDNPESLTSAATAAVTARPNIPATGAPTISGTPQAGQTLSASTSDIVDSDGLLDVTYSYQWVSNDGNADTDIEDATGSDYEVSDDDVGKTLKVRVTFKDNRDNPESLTSAATTAVTARPNIPATGAPTISGTAQAGQTLAAVTSGITDADGLTGVSYTYQWLADDIDIEDATGETYEVSDDDVGKSIKVRVSFTDNRDNPESLTSAATSAVTARPNRPATGAPTITGTAQAGQTLSASTSGIVDSDGLLDVSYSYQWVSNDGNEDTDIEDATSSDYEVSDDDVGKTLKVRVTFKDNRDNPESLTSTATAEVTAASAGDDSVPSSLEAQITASGVLLTWQAPATDADTVTGYTVERTSDLGGGLTAILLFQTSGTGTSYLNASAATAEAGTVYSYRVRADRGDTAGDWSSSVSVVIPAETVTADDPVQGEVLWSAELTVAESQWLSGTFGYNGTDGELTSTKITWDGTYPDLDIYKLSSTAKYNHLRLMGTAGSPQKNKKLAELAGATKVYDYDLVLDSATKPFKDASATTYGPSSGNDNQGHVVFEWKGSPPEWEDEDVVAVSLRKSYPLDTISVSKIRDTLALVKVEFSRAAAAHTLQLRLKTPGEDASVHEYEVEAGATSMKLNLGGLDPSTVYQVEVSPDSEFPDAHTSSVVTFTTKTKQVGLVYDFSHIITPPTYTVDGVAQPVLWEAELTVDDSGKLDSAYRAALETQSGDGQFAKNAGEHHRDGAGYAAGFWQTVGQVTNSLSSLRFSTTSRGGLDHTSLTHDSVEHDIIQVRYANRQLHFTINSGREKRQAEWPIGVYNGRCNASPTGSSVCETPFDWMLVVEDGQGNTREFRRGDSRMTKKRLSLWLNDSPSGVHGYDPAASQMPFGDYNTHTWDVGRFDWEHGDTIDVKLVKLPTNRVTGITVTDSTTDEITVEVTYEAPEDYTDKAWSGTMTVGSHSTGFGYRHLPSLGSLAPDSFTLDGDFFWVRTVALSGSTLGLVLSSEPEYDFEFRVGNESFRAADATKALDSNNRPIYSWSGTSLSWAANDSVSLSLLFPHEVYLNIREIISLSPGNPAATGIGWSSLHKQRVSRGAGTQTFQYTFEGLREGIKHQIRASFNRYISPTVSDYGREYVTHRTPCEPGGTWCHDPNPNDDD